MPPQSLGPLMVAIAVWVWSPSVHPPAQDGAGEACTISASPEPELTVAEILELRDEPFAKEVGRLSWQDELPSLTELLPVFERCGAATDRDDFDFRYSCGRLVEHTIQQAAIEDEAWFWRLHDELAPASSLRSDIVEALLDRHLRRAVDGLPSAAVPAALSLPVDVPKRLAQAPPEIIEAWRLCAAVSRVYDGRPSSRRGPTRDADGIAFQSHMPEFYDTVAAYLRGRATADATIAAIDRFVWAGSCGTGAEALAGPRNKVLLAAYVDEGRYDLAAGAALALDDPPLVFEGGPDNVGPVLRAAGLDAETIAVGEVLGGRWAAAGRLVRHGSERVARLLLAARSLPGPHGGQSIGENDRYLSTLAAIVEPGTAPCSGQGTVVFMGPKRQVDGPVSPALEDDILALLAERVTRAASLDEARGASNILVHLCRPESLPAFRAMTASRYASIRKDGVRALEALGEDAPELPTALPVVFRVFVNGQLLKATDVDWAVHMEDGRGMSTGAKIDRDGVLKLDRDWFLDPKHRVTEVRVSSGWMESPSELWFSSTRPVPRDLDEPTTISVRTQSLTLALAAGSLGPRGAEIELEVDDGDATAVIPYRQIFETKAASETDSLSFDRLQIGTYRVTVTLPDSVWQAEAIELGDDPAVVTFPVDFRLWYRR